MQRPCIAILLSAFISSCSFTASPIHTNFTVTRAVAPPVHEVHEQVEYGDCSWYGPGFHGRHAAKPGERFNQNAMTAAHKTLPFDSIVEVTNLKTGKSVTVRINDRGPFIKGRIIDLSKAAAMTGVCSAGTAPVKIKVISAAKSA